MVKKEVRKRVLADWTKEDRAINYKENSKKEMCKEKNEKWEWSKGRELSQKYKEKEKKKR